MQLKTSTDYALRIVCYLAMKEGMISTSELSRKLMLVRCRLEPLQMDRLIRRRQSKESDVPEVLQEK